MYEHVMLKTDVGLKLVPRLIRPKQTNQACRQCYQHLSHKHCPFTNIIVLEPEEAIQSHEYVIFITVHTEVEDQLNNNIHKTDGIVSMSRF